MIGDFTPGTKIRSQAMNDKLNSLADGTGDDPKNQLERFRSLSGISFVGSGLTVVTSANLTTTLAAGEAYIKGVYAAPSLQSITVTASQDTYLDLTTAGNIVLVPVANNAAAPALTANSIRLAKLVSSTTAITSTTDLRVLHPVQPIRIHNPHKFSVYPSADLALTANVWTKAPLNTELFDTGNNFDSTTNYRFTASVPGFYQFNGQITVGTGGISTGYGEGALYVNGVAKVYGHRQVGSGSATTVVRSRVDKLLQLATGDYVELYGYCSEAGRSLGGGQDLTYLTGFLVSAT